MSEPDGASPVAAAAEWLARQGVEATPPAGPTEPARPVAAPTGSAPGPGRPGDHRDRPQAGGHDDGEPDPYAVARSIALGRLAGRDRTRHELAQALRTKDVPAGVAEDVLDRLEDVGLVNDAAFAEAWVESRQQRRHLSRTALRRELHAKGVSRDEVGAALESVGLDDEIRAARALAERRHHGLAGLLHEVRYRRLAGVLGRRGFGPAVITQVLREVLDGQDRDDPLP